MSPLHVVGTMLRDALATIPLGAVRVVFVAIPLLLMVWVLRLPAAQTTPGDGRTGWEVDLRVWAWLALGLQVVVYCLF
jgi:hypothetical protein